MRFLVRLIAVFLSVRTQDTAGPTCSRLSALDSLVAVPLMDPLLPCSGPWEEDDMILKSPDCGDQQQQDTLCANHGTLSALIPLKCSPLPTTLPFWNGTTRVQTWPQLRAWRTICQFINTGKSEILEFTRGESCGLVRTGMKCPNRYLPLPMSLSLKKWNIWSSWQSAKVRSCF